MQYFVVCFLIFYYTLLPFFQISYCLKDCSVYGDLACGIYETRSLPTCWQQLQSVNRSVASQVYQPLHLTLTHVFVVCLFQHVIC